VHPRPRGINRRNGQQLAFIDVAACINSRDYRDLASRATAEATRRIQVFAAPLSWRLARGSMATSALHTRVARQRKESRAMARARDRINPRRRWASLGLPALRKMHPARTTTHADPKRWFMMIARGAGIKRRIGAGRDEGRPALYTARPPSKTGGFMVGRV